LSGVEFRSTPTGELVLTGFASVYGVPYDVGGMFTETMKRGCAKRSIADNTDCSLLIEHAGLSLARTRSPSGGEPTLKLSEPEEKGLFCEGRLDPRNPRVQELRSVSEHTGLGMSVGMRVNDDRWSKDLTEREILSASFVDVTACTFPANPATSMGIDERAGTYKVTPEERSAFVQGMKGQVERRMCPGFDVPIIGESHSKSSARSAELIDYEARWDEEELELAALKAGVWPRRRSTGYIAKIEAANLRDERELREIKALLRR
jgi:uncharacterized protein